MHGTKEIAEEKASYCNFFFLDPIATVKNRCSHISALEVRNLMASH